MKNRAYGKYYAKYKTVITAIARKLGGSDDDLVDDLVQEGCIALLALDPEKATSNEDAWIRQALKYRMVDALRRYSPMSYESLTQRLENGDQLERDEDTGDVRLLSGRPGVPTRLPSEDDD